MSDANAIELLPMNSEKFDYEFPHPFYEPEYDEGSTPYTLVELNMMDVMGSIKDKPLWYEKINNPEIANKWREEIKSQTVNGKVMHESQIDYIFDELRYYATKNNKELSISPVDGVWQSDFIISEELRQKLASQVAVLEKDCNDWHPGSNNQMLDLVHPSLYPYVAGVSRELAVENNLQMFLPFETIIGNDSRVVERNLAEGDDSGEYYFSSNYQWLPSEVVVDENGRCKILSYINNLHPVDHADLYQTLEQILEKFIPLYNNVLIDLIHSRVRRHDTPMSRGAMYPKDPNMELTDYNYDEWHETHPPVIKQEVQPFDPETMADIDERVQPIELKNSRLQVIFKLANIVLTPENPVYNGGAWHVEGMKNEHIVASGIYYWHTENITESKLSFRVNVREPEFYEQNDNRGVKAVYGLQRDRPLVQNLGSVTCIQGRSICWPNMLQHQVQNFTLQDPTKNGVRKILVFFLVDPSKRAISTSIVPPQQEEWIKQEYDTLLSPLFRRFPRVFPKQIQELILEYSGEAYFSHDLALEVRLKLMDERKYFTEQNTEERFQREFSLCEH